ncbi:hypothetical protein E2C01_070309 [Portunus trituberculatus]|uniref:Uncharacterized protein n=1 Tax=Portunus trituberculatus TaxID=210409 RepID=A0A5B7I1X6_PORTR|nr:hypothetical protein [Portunus trituberculatus]
MRRRRGTEMEVEEQEEKRSRGRQGDERYGSGKSSVGRDWKREDERGEGMGTHREFFSERLRVSKGEAQRDDDLKTRHKTVLREVEEDDKEEYKSEKVEEEDKNEEEDEKRRGSGGGW